jgi:hypothetical protein
MNARTVTALVAASAVMMAATIAGAAWLAAGGPPWAGPDSGYSPPQTMVLVSGDGRTLQAGYVACVKDAAMQAIERPGSVTLRVYWHGPGGCAPSGAGVAMAELTLNYQVHLASPLGTRRLVGPDGLALPWLNQAALLTFPGSSVPRSHRNPASAPPLPALTSLPLPQSEPLLPGARCLQTQGLQTQGPGRPEVEQCAYGGGTPLVMPSAGALVTVRGRAAHLLQGYEHSTPPLARHEAPWRGLWWAQDGTIVVLVSQDWLPGDPPPLPAASLVALANSLSCQQPAACR